MQEHSIKIHTIPTPYVVGPVDIFELWRGGKHILIDTGPQTQIAQEYLTKNIDLSSLDYIFITHGHPDHYGLLHFLSQNSPAEIIVPEVDAKLYELFDERVIFLVDELSQFGFPEELEATFHQLIPKFQGDIPFPKEFSILEQSSQLLQDLDIHTQSCPGHSQSDIHFHIDEQVITGDTLLRNIFTAPMLDLDLRKGQGRFLNYDAYCESIPKFFAISEKEILPSHNQYVESVREQILFYVNKTLKRAQKIAPLAKEGKSKYEILNHLTPKMEVKPFFYYVKAGELYFFLDFLQNPAKLLSALEQAEILAKSFEKAALKTKL